MAKMEKMVPHILLWEVGQTKEEIEKKIWNSLTPRQIYDRVKSRGYHVVTGDKGGPTMCGVTLNTFKDWRKRMGKPMPGVNDLKTLQYDEWLAILKQMFWDPCKADQIHNQSIAQMLVDWRWVNGTQAVRDAQTVLSCVADGIVGPKTLGALNAADSLSVFNRLKNARLRSYARIVERSPSQMRFYNGWVNRTNSITFTP
ncbi:MAG: peptidoglycan domain protein [Muribaculaceae bacterium]|nr:peptidoglycan domain protein [Muribaculaceae bacterium]